MGFYIHVQETPNPNAAKFLSQYVVKNEGKAHFRNVEDSAGIPLAARLMALDGVESVFFYDNYVTVTKREEGDWDVLSPAILDLLQELLPQHDPAFSQEQPAHTPSVEMTPALMQISDILDRTVRPFLAADGGGLELLAYQDHLLLIRYQGACGTCPSSASGTLMAIESILRDEFDPEIRVADAGESQLFSGYD